MSLQNPNNVVTEERLAQFYQQILPYLGGMPEVMMNRFPKGNIYDVDHEVIVGRWIDGKPIYQKTVAYTNKKLYDDYTTLSLNTDPIEAVINGVIVFKVNNAGQYNGSMLQVNIYPSSGGTEVQVYKTGTWNADSNRTFYLTAWYTKIGDSAVEIGDDTDYSTTEKIVGTWIDGKPIYQIVYSGVVPVFNGDVVVDANIASDVKLLDYNTIFTGSSNGRTENPGISDALYIDNRGLVYYYNRSSGWEYLESCDIIVRYTKTSS